MSLQDEGKILVELQAVYGGDKDVAAAAWTSSLDYQKKKQRTDEDVKRVVNMLADSKHSVPFESIILKWWIRLPVAIDRQFMTHRLQSASGQSARYRTMPSDYLEIPEDVLTITDKLGAVDGVHFKDAYNEVCSYANGIYNIFIQAAKEKKTLDLLTNEEYKRLREFTRGMLPQHNMTERVSIMNLRSWANFYKLRSKSDAQKEIQGIANAMYAELQKHPEIKVTLEALERNGWNI